MIFTCHFDFFNNHYRQELLQKFVSTYPECKVAKYEDKNNTIFIKENLLNNIIREHIDNIDYVFWIDYDVEFQDKEWYTNTIKKFEQGYDIVQPFSVSFHENKHGILERKEPGVVYAKQALPSSGGHCGFAWAMTTRAFLHLNGLYEYNIFGTSDGVMANCFMQQHIPNYLEVKKMEKKLPHFPFSEGHYATMHDYYNKCKDLKTGYIEGTVVHKYHGELWRRCYTSRYKFYEENNFDPQTMLYRENNILKIRPEYPKLIDDCKKFLIFKEKL